MTQEGIGLGEDEKTILTHIYWQSKGSLRDAIMILDQISVSGVENAYRALGLGKTTTMKALYDAIIEKDVIMALEQVRTLIEQEGAEPSALMQLFIKKFHGEMRKAVEGEDNRTAMFMKVCAGNLLKAQADAERLGEPRIHFEMAVMNMCNNTDFVLLSDVLDKLIEMEDRVMKLMAKMGEQASVEVLDAFA